MHGIFFEKIHRVAHTEENYTACCNSQVFTVRQVIEEMSRQVLTFQVDKLGYNVNIILLDLLELELCFLSVTCRIIRLRICNFML